MIRNYYTLKHITEKINSFQGFAIVEVFSQEKDTLIIELTDGNTEITLEFIGNGKNDSLYFKSKFNRARKNLINLFQDIYDETIQNTELLINNRVIKISLINTDLYAVLFGGKHSNFFAVSKNGIIIDTFKNKEDLVGTNFSLKYNSIKDINEFSENTKIIDALSKSRYQLGKVYAKEILFRQNIINDTKLKDISFDKLQKIRKYAENFIEELNNSKRYYIFESNNDLIFSLTNLSEYEIHSSYDDINYAIQKTIALRERADAFNPEYKSIFNALNRLEKKYSNQISATSDTDASKERIEKYRLYAEILSSSPTPNLNTGEKYDTKDWSGNDISIPTDKKLNLIKNAEKYFEKARKSKEDLKIREKRLPDIKRKHKQVSDAISELNKAISIKDLELIKKKYKSIPGLIMQNEPKQAEDKFRTFDLGEGFVLYVGKNAANNDELTMKFAKPNDLWFHARGTSGSHAVLRLEKGQKPPKHILQKACEITAYYSGQKNAKLAPVAYTYKKYVRKPKGANPGSVVISKETVEMAKPGIPQEL
jgi:predicted ribosome quality control (RQC) complex YloA/Tae2 family protein